MIDSCNRAVFGWPSSYGDGRPVVPCVGYIESDYAPGTYYPHADGWLLLSIGLIAGHC